MEAGVALAKRLLREAPAETPERISYGFRLCVGRNPRPAELVRLTKYFEDQHDIFRREATTAPELAVERPGKMETSEMAAWVMLSSVLLNLDEFITRE